jgi:vacuolar-type H+-ATPase subunit F/Vma7
MSQSVLAICRPEVAAGFGLAGLRTNEVANATEAGERLRDVRHRPEVGVILIEEALYNGLTEDLRREFGRRPLPMIVPFPGPFWEMRAEAAEAYIVELLRQVVGYRVRLK